MKKKAQKQKQLSRKDKKFLLFIEKCVKEAKRSRKNKNHKQFYENYLKPPDPKRTFSAYKSLFEENISKLKNFVAEKKSLEEYERKADFLPEEIKKREKQAIKIAKEKAKSVAPLYNKGAYQPISVSDLKTIGKKV